jgi:endonuclease YncB( thermonuclease family)
MAKAIQVLPSGLTIGLGLLGKHGDGRGSPAQQVHDGDTIIVEAAGNISVRFLGIDTPEVSFTLPGSDQFRGVSSTEWDRFLTDPLEGASETFLSELGPGLLQHLATVTGPGCALNHADHAEQAHQQLEQHVISDMQVLGQDRSTFYFFMAFASEIMDGYGRFLCFINRRQEDATLPEPRPLSYNERLLEAGVACPYFIWPNVNPFRRQPCLVDAVPRPAAIADTAEGQNGLGQARQWVRNARQQHLGIFSATDPLMLQPFELRFLSRRTAPSRWVIDLSDTSTRYLMHPTAYHTVANIEDRLFIPEQYVSLFVECGWRRQ